MTKNLTQFEFKLEKVNFTQKLSKHVMRLKITLSYVYRKVF
jgi:hypothetical protein